MRYLASHRKSWWAAPLTAVSYVIGPILPFLFEFCVRDNLFAVSAVVIALCLLFHEFTVAREIEYIRPYSSTSVGKHFAWIDERVFQILCTVYWTIKYTTAFLVLPLTIHFRGNRSWALNLAILICLLVIVSDIKRIYDVIRRSLLKERGRKYIGLFRPLVFSYISFILSFTLLYYSLYSLDVKYFKGDFGLPTTVDFLYFNTITFTTLGYGDITPFHWLTRLLVSGENIISYLLFAFTIASILNMVEEYHGKSGPVESEALNGPTKPYSRPANPSADG